MKIGDIVRLVWDRMGSDDIVLLVDIQSSTAAWPPYRTIHRTDIKVLWNENIKVLWNENLVWLDDNDVETLDAAG